MSDGGVVRSNGVIEAHWNVIEAACDELHDGDESGGGTGDALTHAKSVIESVGGVEGRQRGSLRVDGYLSEL